VTHRLVKVDMYMWHLCRTVKHALPAVRGAKLVEPTSVTRPAAPWGGITVQRHRSASSAHQIATLVPRIMPAINVTPVDVKLGMATDLQI